MNLIALNLHFSSYFVCFAYTNGNYRGGGGLKPPASDGLVLHVTLPAAINSLQNCEKYINAVDCKWYALSPLAL
jgi:hypothetical protein